MGDYFLTLRRRMNWKRGAAALTFCILAFVAVTWYTGHDNAAHATVEEAVAVDTNNEELPQDVDSFVEVSMNKGKSFTPWRHFVLAKRTAQAKASKKAFKAAAANCALLRSAAYRKCGATYCKMKKTCGSPCKKKFGQPPLQVVPLTPGGPKFYKVHEVAVKENKAKEMRAKEKAAKERAAKERKKKEKAYKEKVAKEKVAKEKKHKELKAKEKVAKEKSAKERKKKEKAEKARERARKQSILLKCTKRGDAAKSKCEKKKAAELDTKAKEAAFKAKK